MVVDRLISDSIDGCHPVWPSPTMRVSSGIVAVMPSASAVMLARIQKIKITDVFGFINIISLIRVMVLGSCMMCKLCICAVGGSSGW